MKARHLKPKQEFVPVVVILESQKEVDALFAIGNDTRVCDILPALGGMYGILRPFKSDCYGVLNDRLDSLLG